MIRLGDGTLDLGVKRQPNWKYVEMPPTVAALPRSAGGLPVPWVAQWDGEEDMRVAPCRWANGRDAVFPAAGSQIGLTRPVFGIMEPSRQREAVGAVRCQVCRGDLSEMSDTLDEGREPLWLIDLMHEPKTMRGHRLVLEPWVCDDCLVYALQVCPGMLLASPPPGHQDTSGWRIRNVLAVWTSNAIGVMTIPRGNLEGAAPCFGYFKIEPLLYRRLSSFHLLEHGPAEIRSMLVADGPPS